MSTDPRTCAMIFVMKQTALEPGLLNTLRVYVIGTTILLPFVWQRFSPALGVQGALAQFITPGEVMLVFLVIYLLVPWWQSRMGRLFLPVAFLLLASHVVAGNYLTLQWLVPPPMRGPAALALLLHAWVTISFWSCLSPGNTICSG